MAKVSIIVPAYNSENTIKNSIDSALGSTYQDIEVVVINDGSTDHTESIIKNYMEKDSRVRLISKENGGVSSARNCGIEYATGELIMFLDADDTYEMDFCQRVVECYSNDHVDIVMAGYNEIFDGNKKTIGCPFDRNIEGQENIRKKIITDYFLSGVNGYMGTVCFAAFKRSLILDHEIRFNHRIHHGEDRLFLIQYLLLCECFGAIKEPMYNYMLGDSSVTKKYSPTIAENNALLGDAYAKLYSEVGYVQSEETKGNSAVASVFSLIVNEARRGNPKKLTEQIKYVASVNKDYKSVIRKLHTNNKTLKIKRMIALHPSLCVLFFLLRRIQRSMGGYF